MKTNPSLMARDEYAVARDERDRLAARLRALPQSQWGDTFTRWHAQVEMTKRLEVASGFTDRCDEMIRYATDRAERELAGLLKQWAFVPTPAPYGYREALERIMWLKQAITIMKGVPR